MRNIQLVTFLLALSMAPPLLAQEEDFRKEPPAPGPAPRIQLSEYEQFTLDNGLNIIVVENHKLPRVSFQLLVDVPLIKEGEFAGTADLAGELLSRGTENRTKAEIDEAVDYIGATFTTDSEGMFGACLTKHKEKLLEVMADVLLNPSFPEEEFEKLKKQRLSALLAQKSNPNTMAANTAQALRYGDEHPYGEIVTEASLENITAARCTTYYDNYFIPNLSYLAVVGDIQPEEAKKLAEQYFGAWEKGTVTKDFFVRPEPPAEPVVAIVDKPEAVQAVISVTYPVNLKPGTPDVIVANVLNTLLGGGMLGSRLNRNIREDKGYSYGVRSSLNYDKYVGEFSAGGSARNEVADSTVAELLYEMQRLRDEPVPEEELQSVKNYIFGSFARIMERPETIARLALNTARYKLPKDFYATYLEKVAEVSPADVQELARKYLLPERAYIVVAGNEAAIADNLARFSGAGEVAFYDAFGQPLANEEMAVPEGLSAQDIIENYLLAIGGREALDTINDLTTLMNASVQGMSLQMTIQRKAPEKLFLEVTMNGMAMSTTKFDGEQGVSSTMGSEKKLEGDNLEGVREQALLFHERFYLSKGYTMELAGIEMVEGKRAYRVDVVTKAGNESTEYYDVQSGLKLRSSTVQEGPDGTETTVVTDFSDYQAVDGIKYPFKVTSTGMAPVPIVFEVESVAFNTGLEDSIFEVE